MTCYTGACKILNKGTVAQIEVELVVEQFNEENV
jgi:hypothetical protein